MKGGSAPEGAKPPRMGERSEPSVVGGATPLPRMGERSEPSVVGGATPLNAHTPHIRLRLSYEIMQKQKK